MQELIAKGEVLPLMEAFYTLQGEGFYKGTAAYFIRLGGCDVGCHWCDVKESWDASLHTLTGGEPLMYNLLPLTELLKSKGARTHIETSGAHPLTGIWDWICLSPKKNKRPLPLIHQKANELKMIIYNQNDFLFAEEMSALTQPECIRYLQPEWSRKEKMIPKMVEYVLAHPQWKISLQRHKYLDIP